MSSSAIRRLADSSISGFGLSAGDAAFRSLRNNPGAIALTGLIAFVFFGFGYVIFAMVRGYNRSWAKTLFVTIGWNVILGAIYFGATFVFMFLVFNTFGKVPTGKLALDTAAALAVGTGLLGLIVGLVNRIPRKARYRVENHNISFLQQNGIRDVGGAEETFVDAEGRELNVRDVRKDAIVFNVGGNASRRAYIRLDDKGRMTAYEPA